jgi:hypothetical protein
MSRRRGGASHAGWTDAELEEAYAAAAKAGVGSGRGGRAAGGGGSGGRSSRSARSVAPPSPPSAPSVAPSVSSGNGRPAKKSSGGRDKKSSSRRRGGGAATGGGGSGGRGSSAVAEDEEEEDEDDEGKKKKRLSREQYRAQQEALRLGAAELPLPRSHGSSSSSRGRARGGGRGRGGSDGGSGGMSHDNSSDLALWYNNDVYEPINDLPPSPSPTAVPTPSRRYPGNGHQSQSNDGNVDIDVSISARSSPPLSTTTPIRPLPSSSRWSSTIADLPSSPSSSSSTSNSTEPRQTIVHDVTAYRARASASDNKRQSSPHVAASPSSAAGSSNIDDGDLPALLSDNNNGIEVIDHNPSLASSGFRYREQHHRRRGRVSQPSPTTSASWSSDVSPTRSSAIDSKRGSNDIVTSHDYDDGRGRGSGRGGGRSGRGRGRDTSSGTRPYRNHNGASNNNWRDAPAVDDSNLTQEEKDAAFARSLFAADEKVSNQLIER